MSELPEGWVEVPLGELGTWYGGGTPSKGNSSFWTNGTVPWVSPKDMKRPLINTAEDFITVEAVAGSSTKLVPKDSVLMVVRSGILAHTFPVAINTVDVTLNQDMKAVSTNRVSHHFVAYGLRAFGSRILDECTKSGTTVASVNTDALHAFEIPLPPLNEQKRIVAKIDALTEKSREAKEALEEVPALLEKLRQSILAAAFRGDLTKEWRAKNPNVEPASVLLGRIRAERRKKWEEAELAKLTAKGKPPKDDSWKSKYVEPDPVDTEGLPELPEGWCWASLGELTTRVTSGSRAWSQYYDVGSGTFIMAQNIRPDGLDMSFRQAVAPPEGDAERERTAIVQDDLLMTIVGAGTGDACIVPAPLDEHYVCQSVALIRFAMPNLARLFWRYFQASPGGRSILETFMYGQGRPHLSFDQLKGIALPIPPFEELAPLSTAIDASLERLRTTASGYAMIEAARESLSSSILAKALRGELVPQDPNDEPASVLLERIKNERAAASEKGEGTKKAKGKRGK